MQNQLKKLIAVAFLSVLVESPASAQGIDPDLVPPEPVLTMQGAVSQTAPAPVSAPGMPPAAGFGQQTGSAGGQKFIEPVSFEPQGWPFEGASPAAAPAMPQMPFMGGRAAMMQQLLQQQGMATAPGQAPFTGQPPAAGASAYPPAGAGGISGQTPTSQNGAAGQPDAANLGSSAGPSAPAKKGCPNCKKKKMPDGTIVEVPEDEDVSGATSGQSQKDPVAVIQTTQGTIVIRLFRQYAPQTVKHFLHLADSGFYNGIRWHRVVPGFVIQAGCPKGDGTGGFVDSQTGQPVKINIELNPMLRHNAPGVVAMARFGNDMNSASSQFYITQNAAHNLDNKYSIFGGVISGMDVVNRITTQDKIISMQIQ